MSANTIFVNIHYGNRILDMEMSSKYTVGDLKAKLYSKINVFPRHQKILGWFIEPLNDDTFLNDCCCKGVNNLVVVNLENEENNKNEERGSVAKENNYGQNKPESCKSKQFNGILFNPSFTYELENIKNKIIMLLFGKPNSDFSTKFYEIIYQDDVLPLLNNFLLIEWHQSCTAYRSQVISFIDDPNISRIISRVDKKDAALFIVPVQNSFMLHTFLNEKIDKKNFVSSLKNALERLNSSLQMMSLEKSTQMLGSVDFQQLMLEMLGDRDYDCFEYSEHEHLKNTIGFALFGAPMAETGYERKQTAKIEQLYQTIVKNSNKISKWKDRIIISCIYVCAEPLPEVKIQRSAKDPKYDPKTDNIPIPIFVLRKCKKASNPCRIFIDTDNRVYQSWTNYLSENKLHECYMVLPKNGKYEKDEKDKVLLEYHLSPACGISAKLLQVLDTGSCVGGIAAGGIFVLSSFLTVNPIVLGAATAAGISFGIYGLGRNVYTLYDKWAHGESMNFMNGGARGAYINILAGALGFVGAGANTALIHMAKEGVLIGEGASAAINMINAVNLAVGGVAMANASYDVIHQWINERQRPSLLIAMQLGSSILFFGHAVYNFQTVGTLIEEAQINYLTEYQKNLRGKGLRKAFNKIVKETIRQNDGNIMIGRTEVIATLKNINNPKEVFAVLTRGNKDMNRAGVRFAARGGDIYLNNVKVDMKMLGDMSKVERITYLSQIPSIDLSSKPQIQKASIGNWQSNLSNIFPVLQAAEALTLSYQLYQAWGPVDKEIVDKVTDVLYSFIEYLKKNEQKILDALREMFPGINYYFQLIGMIIKYFQKLINECENEYNKWKYDGEENSFFDNLSENLNERTSQIFKKIVNLYFSRGQEDFQKLLKHFHAWFAEKSYEFYENENRRTRRRNHGAPGTKISCSYCKGYYYSHV